MKTRREFLELGALAALAGSARAFGGEMPLAVKGIRIGVQMWSVNDLWKKNPADALRRLKALGYDGVVPRDGLERAREDAVRQWPHDR